MPSKLPNWLKIVLILAAFGLVRSPVENSLRRKMNTAGMLLPTPGHSAMAQMGQSALMGMLGGLRTLVATGYLLDSYRHFDNADWDANRKSLLLATYLEPTEESHWVDLVWHRGINAPAWLETRARLPEIEKRILYHEYTRDAIELGEAGLKNLPKSVEIRKQMAEVYREKIKDPCGTAKMYKEMLGLEGAPMYANRFYGYFLSECPGKEKEGYDHLVNLYWEGSHNHLPTLIKKILVLQEELDIPVPLWIREKDPDAQKQINRRIKKPKPLPGGIVIP
ncbi:MAG: hypothetical protein P1U89_15430 [Verrucomicrobiales bacterium]|nr:hypothetical protein [Verrucomicrobiales bacterium]